MIIYKKKKLRLFYSPSTISLAIFWISEKFNGRSSRRRTSSSSWTDPVLRAVKKNSKFIVLWRHLSVRVGFFTTADYFAPPPLTLCPCLLLHLQLQRRPPKRDPIRLYNKNYNLICVNILFINYIHIYSERVNK